MHDRKDRGWLKAGDLDLPKPPSPSSSSSTPPPSLTNSTTTGSLPPVNGQQNAIGARHGGPGAVAKRKTLDEAETPEERTRALAAMLPPSVNSSLRAIYDDRVDPAYGWDGELVGYRAITPLDVAACATAMDMVAPWLKPLDRAQIGVELTRLKVGCKTRPEEQEFKRLWLEVMHEECAKYPADVVTHVLRSWQQRETFTPSLAEMRDGMQRCARSRRSLAATLGYGEQRAG